MKVIEISGKAMAGKDTTAEIMKNQLESNGANVLITHFADLLKFICKQYFDWDGQKNEYGRTLLQYVGTDVIRDQQKRPDYWVDFVIDILKMFGKEWDYVIIPDCRFPNELHNMRMAGFDVTHVLIERWNGPLLTFSQQQHESETAMDGIKPDYTIKNDGTMVDLAYAVREFIKEKHYE